MHHFDPKLVQLIQKQHGRFLVHFRTQKFTKVLLQQPNNQQRSRYGSKVQITLRLKPTRAVDHTNTTQGVQSITSAETN